MINTLKFDIKAPLRPPPIKLLPGDKTKDIIKNYKFESGTFTKFLIKNTYNTNLNYIIKLIDSVFSKLKTKKERTDFIGSILALGDFMAMPVNKSKRTFSYDDKLFLFDRLFYYSLKFLHENKHPFLGMAKTTERKIKEFLDIIEQYKSEIKYHKRFRKQFTRYLKAATKYVKFAERVYAEGEKIANKWA